MVDDIMNNLRLSVAMCTYNGAHFIREQLDSIKAQTRLPDELIVCDDNSTDETLCIVENFAEKAPFAVKIYQNKEQLGSTKNFEKAIDLCSGDIIFLADQDDIWMPKKLALIENIFNNNPNTGAVFSNADIVDENLNFSGHYLWNNVGFDKRMQQQVKSGKIVPILLKRNVVTGATMAFRSTFKKTILPIPGNWVHDYWISLFIAMQSSLSCIDVPLVKYRQHSAQQIGTSRKTVFQKLANLEQSERLINDDINRYRNAYNHMVSVFDESGIEKYSPLFEEIIHHLNLRKNLTNKKIPGLLVVIKELIAGRYHRYSNSCASVLGDTIRVFSS